MSKRIAFLINRMNFRASSGHGIFMKGAVETLLKHGHFIDIVCDGEPEENFLSEHSINVYSPNVKDRLGYTKHNYLFQFEDSFNYEKAINFRAALTKALSNHLYDLIICNDLESAFVCYQMGLSDLMKVTSYAHECASINPELKSGVFKPVYYNLIEKQMTWPELTTLVQTSQNKEKLETVIGSDHNLRVQLYPLTDSQNLHISDREGILYIGRHEDRKNPSEFIKLLADIKSKYSVEVKANVLTRSAHVQKFEADFQSIGHTNYEIKSDVVGEEKARIIQSSKVAFMPYKNESFGIAVLEALRFMPTIVLKKFDWHYNFRSFSNYIVADSKEVTDVVWNAYNSFEIDENKVEAEFAEYNTQYESALLGLLEDLPTVISEAEPRNRLYKHLKSCQGKWVSLTNYFSAYNDKGVIYLTSDIETMYVIRNWCTVMHTNQETFLGIPDESGNLVLENANVDHSISLFFE